MGVLDIVNKLLVRVGVRKPEPKLTREQSMNAIPIRNPLLRWAENDKGEIVVAMDRRDDWVGETMGWLFMVPPKQKVELDDIGSSVWRACDGENTVNEIIEIIRREYKLSRREVEMSLTKYLQSLGQRKMIGFMVDRETAEAAGIDDDQEVVGLEDVAKTKDQLEEARVKAEKEAAEGQRLLEETEQRRKETESPEDSDDEEPSRKQPADDEPLIKIENPDSDL
ncbi:MAG: PqqD family protein [Armatimonadota bacterium]